MSDAFEALIAALYLDGGIEVARAFILPFITEGKTAEAAARHQLPLLAEMPIDPALAALADAGDIESFQGNWLDGAADAVEKLL